MIDSYSTLSEKFLRKGFWLYFFAFLTIPLGYIVRIIISGELSVSEVGILYGIISLLSLISIYNDLGMTESIKFFAPKFVNENRYDKLKSILVYALLFQTITSITFSCFFFFGADFLAEHYFKNPQSAHVLQIFTIFLIGINIFQTINNFFLAVQNTFYNRLTEFLRMLFVLISVLFVFFGNFGNLMNYSLAWIVGLYIGIIFCVFVFYNIYFTKYFKQVPIIWSKKLLKKILSYALMVLFGLSLTSILGQMDLQMVLFLLGTEQAGYYTNYLSILSIANLFIGPIFIFLFPVFSELHSKNDIEKIKLTKSIFGQILILTGIIFSFFFFVFGTQISYVLFGKKFITSGIFLQFSILFISIRFLSQVNSNLLAGIGKIKERIKFIGFVIIFNFICNLIFIQFIGAAGAALATGLGWVLIYVFFEIALGKKYFVHFNYFSISKNFFCFLILGIFSYYFGNKFLQDTSRITSMLILFLISIIWIGFFIFINYSIFRTFILEVKKLKKKNV